MIARAAALVAAALVLSGCAAVAPPGPTDLEVAEYNERMVQNTWISTGITEIFARPDVEQGAALSIDDWFNAVFACLSANGFDGFSISYSYATGSSIGDSSGEVVTDAAAQLAFYRCAAANPVDVLASGELLSPAQIDYVYDYYQEWVVPCMIAEGFIVRDPPTRQDFHDLFGQWSPYWSVHNTIGGTEVEDLQAVCGADRPAL